MMEGKNSSAKSLAYERLSLKNNGSFLKRISLLPSTVWFIAECLLYSAFFLIALVPLIPFTAVLNILKVAERVFAKMISDEIPLTDMDAICVPCTAENPVIINALYCFENKGSIERGVENFRQAILERMVNAKKANGNLLYPRVRCYLRPGWLQYFFHKDPSFKIENHVFKWKGEIPRSRDELATVVSKMSNEPFPEGRSPWYHCCIPTNFGDNDIFVMFRIKHYLADGTSLSKFTACDLPDKKTLPTAPLKFSFTGRLFRHAKALLLAPRFIMKLFFSSADQSILHGPQLSGVRKVAWYEAIDLQLIKDIKSATGTTVNDVLTSCLSLALRRYLQRKGIENPDDFTAAVAVDVRSRSSSIEITFENLFTFVFPKLAVATDGVVKQLYETKARMDEIKFSGLAWASDIAHLTSQNLLPVFCNFKINNFCLSKASCLLSNVPGPQHMLTVNGNRMKYLTCWPPNASNIGISISFTSYAGQVIVGVQSDASVLPDPVEIIDEFVNAVNEMASCILPTNDGDDS